MGTLFLLLIFVLCLFGILLSAGYALLHDYPIWQIIVGLLLAAIVIAAVGLALLPR
jgi:hypothetical protein